MAHHPDSKPKLVDSRKYQAFDKDGKYKGEVRLNMEARLRYERMGFTFKPFYK